MTPTAKAPVSQPWEGPTRRQEDTFEEELVSPELVLVDPELARRVRPTLSTGAWSSAVSAGVAIPMPVVPLRPMATDTGPPRNGSPPESPQALRGVVIAVVAACSGFAAGALFLGEEGASPGRMQAVAPVHGRLGPPTPMSQHTASTAKSARRRLAGPTRVTAKASRATRPVAVPRASAHSVSSRSSRVSWQQTRFATFYNIVFIRGGARALQIWTRRTDLRAAALRLRAGKYRWTVRPGYGNPRLRKLPGRTFYGPVVSRGVLVIPRGQ
jgi:hypothetical protein